MKTRALSLGLLALLPSCRQGQGSDIGPDLVHETPFDYRVLVRDDAGLPVCGARMTVSGQAGSVVTGRPGRAVWPSRLFGQRLISIDGSAGSATDSDRLGSIGVGVDAADGSEPSFVVFLPDLAASSALLIPTGPQSVARTLDDSASSGAVVTIPAGANVTFGGQSSVTLRTGRLSAGHLPPLPPLASGARLAPFGIAIDPPSVIVSPAASLVAPNDLKLQGGAIADVLYLDPQTGSWTVLGGATVSGGGATLTANGVITRGGLYVFAATLAANARIEGGLVDTENRPLEGAFVSAGEAKAISDGSGRFVLDGVSAVYGDGSSRSLSVEVYGGYGHRSTRLEFVQALAAGTVDAGVQEIEAPRSGTVSLLQINLAAREPGRRIRISSTSGLSHAVTIGDGEAEAHIEEQDQGFTSTVGSWVKDDEHVYLTEATSELRVGDPALDLRLFAREFDFWLSRKHGTLVYPLDLLGSGLIEQVAIATGQTPGRGFVGRSNLSPVVVDYGSVGEVMGAMLSTRLGKTVISVTGFVDPDTGRLELPIERALRDPIGSFDRHGRIAGSLTGAVGSGRVRKIGATRRLTLEDWYESVWFARDTLGSVPKKIDPELTSALLFDIGVPSAGGHLVAVEGVPIGGALSLERVGILADLQPDEGVVETRALDLSLPCTTIFSMPAIFTNLHPTLGPGDFVLDLGAELNNGSVLDIARTLSINPGSGTGALILLPSLANAGASRWLASVSGFHTAAGKSVAQRAFVPFDSVVAPTTLFPVPDITSPAPDSIVPASGFTVEYTVPPGTAYIEVELRNEFPEETRVWHAVVPPQYTSYPFRLLSPELPQPLTPGRDFRLTVSAARIATGPISKFTDAYRRAVTHWVGIGEAEREVDAISSTTITVTTQ